MEDLIKLLVSMLLGGLIGLEREIHEKPAGFRTNVLICLGATIFTMISLDVGVSFKQDPGRIAAQIVNGIGFLGAGAILREGLRITGLTTAATIWFVSGVGMAVGYGYWAIAVAAAVAALLVELILAQLENFINRSRSEVTFRLCCDPSWDIVRQAEGILNGAGLKVKSQKVFKKEGKFHIECIAIGSREVLTKATSCLIDIPGISDVET
jgi:putative Mg2+ transporter-C (MgtC) family protein